MFNFNLKTNQITLITFALAFAILAAFALPVSARVKEAGKTIMNTFEGYGSNIYIADDVINFTESIEGDAVLAGEKVTVTGNITGNLIVGAGEFQLDGVVNGDLFLAAGNAVLNADVNGDIRAAAGQIFINSENVKGDLVVASGVLSLSSETVVAGRQLLAGGNQNTKGINQPTDVNSIPGSDLGTRELAELGAAFSIIGAIISLILLVGWFILNYLLIRMFPVTTEATLETMKSEVLLSGVIGFGTFIFFPGVAITLLLTGIGVPLLIVGSVILVLCYFLAYAYSQYLLGRMILVQFGYGHTGRAVALLLGMILVFVLGILPVFGWLIGGMLGALLPAWGTGALILNKWRNLKSMRNTSQTKVKKSKK